MKENSASWKPFRSASALMSFPLWMLAVVVLAAGTAAAVDVVDVRVGQHEKYTRIVFELNDATGYQIERSENASGRDLVISLDARTKPSRFSFEKGFIESLRVEQKGNRAVARIQLRKPGLGLKEMTLAEPARLVVDVLATTTTPTPPVAKAKASKPRPVAPPPVAMAKPPKVESKPAPKVQKVTPPAASPLPTPSKPSAEVTVSKAAAKPAPTQEAKLATPAAQKPSTPAPEIPRVRESAKQAPALGEKPVAAKSNPAPTNAPGEESSGSSLAWVVAGVGLFLLIGAGIAVQRRRTTSDLHEDVFPDPFTSVPPTAELSTSGEQTPSASEEEAVPESTSASVEEPRELDPPVLPQLDEWTLVSGDSLESVDEVIEKTPELAAETQATPALPYPDLSPMLQEIENRVAMLEGRIDEILAEREAGDKQLDAHTEELRVQRAAIARTQRAVRNLSRTEDAGATAPPGQETEQEEN